MSALLSNANGAEIAITPQRSLIVNHPLNSVLQWSKGTSAAPKSVQPGTTTVIDMKFNTKDWEQEINHYLTYTIKNSGASNLTFKNGALNHFHKMKIIPNESEQGIEIDNLASVKSIVADFYLRKYGLDIFEGTSFIRNEWNTFNGITVNAGANVMFYYDLAPFIDFAKTTIRGQIHSLRLELEASPQPSNEKESGKYFLSSDANMAYTASTITFENINYVRQFAIISNPALLVGFLSADKPIRKIHRKAYEYVKYTGSWNKSNNDSYSCKLSDIRKTDRIQHIEVSARPVASAYNDPECCKEYSGHNWIGYKWRQLNTSDEKELDMTNQRILKEHEIQQYHNEFGRLKQLPAELFNDANHPFTKYYLPMTKINFDYLQEISDHEVVRFTSSNQQDYDIEIFANGDVGANVELVFRVVVAQPMEFDKKSGQLTRI